jgi:hypothetical protein
MGDERATAGPAEDEERETMATADKGAAATKNAGEAAVGSLVGARVNGAHDVSAALI